MLFWSVVLLINLSCFALQNELDLLGRIRHPNIVSLAGFCVHGETRFLIYELMHNGSLETQLHGNHSQFSHFHIYIDIYNEKRLKKVGLTVFSLS